MDKIKFKNFPPRSDPINANNGVTLLPFSGVNNINAPLYIQRIVTELGLDPYNPEHDAMFAWLNDENNEAQAVDQLRSRKPIYFPQLGRLFKEAQSENKHGWQRKSNR